MKLSASGTFLGLPRLYVYPSATELITTLELLAIGPTL